jgi:hypothetical protein
VTRSAHDDLPSPAGRGTAIRNDQPPAWETSSALSSVRGIQWWAAVLLALAFTGIGVFVDLERINRLGIIFQVAYFVGCVLAVLWVQRRGLFGPMVQPPLILAVAVPGVVLAAGGSGGGGGITAKALAVGTPLINGFPTMAITTGVTVLIGLIRLAKERAPRPGQVAVRQRQPGDRPRTPRPSGTRSGPAGRRAAARRG